MLRKISNLTKIALLILSSFMLSIVNVNASATITPNSADTSLATPYFYVNVTSCVETFNWEMYVADVNSGIKETAPYNKKGCIRQENFASNGTKTVTKDANDNITAVNYTTGATKINVPLYKDFNGNSNTTAKAVLGDLPVIGITNNGGQLAQNLSAYDINGTSQTKPNCDRVNLNTVTSDGCIWSETELSQIYSTQTARTGAPRIVDTGVDQIYRNSAGKLTYDGGPCYTQNGQMVKRSKIDVGGERERSAISVFPGLDTKTTAVGCDFRYTGGENFDRISINCGTEDLKNGTNRTYMVIDQGMCAYQFLYVIDLPTATQCKTLWGISETDYEQDCLNFWRKRFQKLHNNTMEGNRFIFAKTYYGMFADSSFKCQTVGQTNCNTSYKFSHNGEWKNPDINGPRSNFSTSATREELLAYFGEGYNAYTTEQLRVELNGMVRSLDGGSTYVF